MTKPPEESKVVRKLRCACIGPGEEPPEADMTGTSTYIPIKGHGIGCPLCGSVTGVRAVGTECWGHCAMHLTTWWIGSRAPGVSTPQTENDLLSSIRFLGDHSVLDSDIHAASADPEDLA